MSREMQCQQTQKLETTLLLVNQDMQVRQGNSSGPRAAHLWEGGRYSNNATESQNSWIRNGRRGSVISVPTGSLNDILGNMEKYILVPFQDCFSADPHWGVFPFPCLLLLMERAEGCSASCCPQPWLPTDTSLPQVCTPHPIDHSTCFTGAKETPSHLFYQLPCLPPLTVSTITPAANEFTHTHLGHFQGGSSSWCCKIYTLCTAVNEKSTLSPIP